MAGKCRFSGHFHVFLEYHIISQNNAVFRGKIGKMLVRKLVKIRTKQHSAKFASFLYIEVI